MHKRAQTIVTRNVKGRRKENKQDNYEYSTRHQQTINAKLIPNSAYPPKPFTSSGQLSAGRGWLNRMKTLRSVRFNIAITPSGNYQQYPMVKSQRIQKHTKTETKIFFIY